MSVKVTVERGDEKPGISLKDGDVCLLRCGGVVMVRENSDYGAKRFMTDGESYASFFQNGRDDDENDGPYDVVEVLGNGADFLARVEVVVKVKGE